MAFALRTTGCCGVNELVDISLQPDAKAVIDGILPQLRDNTGQWGSPKPFLYFTSVEGEREATDHTFVEATGYGQALADYIEANDLGTMDRTIEARRNFSGNMIKMWIWMPNYAKLRELCPARQSIATTGW